MLILFFTRRFWPDVGGVETHVLQLSRQLLLDGHRVIIVSEDTINSSASNWQTRYKGDKMTGRVEKLEFEAKTGSGKENFVRIVQKSFFDEKSTSSREEKALQTNSIIVYRLPYVKNDWTKKFLIWKWLWTHRSLMKKADLIHAHDVYFWYIPFRFLYPFKKNFLTFHGYEGVYPPSKKAILIRKVSEKLANENICIGEFIKKWYGTKTKFVTYGGVSKRNNQQSTFNHQHKKELKILFIGRLEEDTGVRIYLDGLKKMRLNQQKFTFEVCGDGSLRKEMEYYGKVHGFVSDVERYIEKADIVFVSSYLSILQALTYGKLVIAAYDNPLKEDYLKMTPYSKWIQIVNIGNDMSNIIDHYIKNEAKYDKILQAEQEWAREQSWEKVKELYYELWKV